MCLMYVTFVVGGSSSPTMKLDQSFGAGDSRLSSRGVSGGSRLIMKRSRSKSETTYVCFSPSNITCMSTLLVFIAGIKFYTIMLCSFLFSFAYVCSLACVEKVTISVQLLFAFV